MDNMNNILKRNVGIGVKSILNDFLDCRDDLREEGTFVGKVLDNNDPEKLGRCKILVYSVFNESANASELPWAIPEFGFIGSLKGSFIVPQVGAFVRVTFENDEINLPKYSTKVLNRNQLPTNKDVDYPDNMIFFETDDGDRFEINRKKKTVLFEHSSGTKFEIDAIGKLTITHKGEWEVNKSIPDPSSGPGPMCGLQQCLYTGAMHQATKTIPIPGV